MPLHPLCSPAKPEPPSTPTEDHYVIITVGYNTEYKSDLTSHAMTYEKAKMQYDRITNSLHYDQTGCFYGVALMRIGHPVAIEIEIL